jgi:hypothetical protein
MAAEPPFSKAPQAIGAYFRAFSAMEPELGETIKVVFRLQRHEAADTITAALGDISKKMLLSCPRPSSSRGLIDLTLQKIGKRMPLRR